MPPDKSDKTARTLSTLIRVGRALREPDPEPGSGVGEAARRLRTRALGSARVQDTLAHVQELRAQAAARADERLETLIGDARARRGQTPPDDVTRLLAQRRQERDEQLQRAQARAQLLARGDTSEQRAILTRVAASTPWAGGQHEALRYTQLLDELAPGGSAAAEMAVHRALWTLAERRVLAVSPHGAITAVPTVNAGPDALPGT
ncbi:hypothetical protein HNQ07_003157 [Deinococcus metalli]|uniref:Uncharacterized protein n=1 Tax=Deinococcus metalli TaxID=1141878 RepID=A0A7W8NS66_9DEIO|nr:hypothetical protein [Deinococcus metalli]MBB5377658.1 hypothetical protein [Deinococcus metalli]GHF52355.1 hypothetical protein GCM10017781_30850 [Deinococcus metalli]